MLTVSSSMTNLLTTVGKIVDVGLEAWVIFVVTAVAGSFATFFSSGDASLSASLRLWSLPNSAWGAIRSFAYESKRAPLGLGAPSSGSGHGTAERAV